MAAELPDNPAELIKDLVLFAPLGAIAIARERLEEFAAEAIERGRDDRAEARRGLRNQIEIARSLGRARVHKAVRDVVARSDEAPFSAVRRVGDSFVQQAQEAAEDVVAQLPVEPQVRAARGVGRDVIREAQARMGRRMTGAKNGEAPSTGPRDAATSGTNGGRRPVPATGDSAHIAISDYESLSAAQINARLGGLSASELTDLRDYEVSHRGRKTILDRVDQELAGRS